MSLTGVPKPSPRCPPGRLSSVLGLGLLLTGACASAPVILQGGRVRVTFSTDETCGLDNPHVANAKGCRVIDDDALMCRGFGVIDGVLFAGGCEAPAAIQVLEMNGTVPVGSASAESDEADSPSAEDG